MVICLDHAPECLKTQSPQEYVKQIAVASQALQKARGVTGAKAEEKQQARTEAEQLLASLRGGLEPDGDG